jgi:hypothetical protein
MSSSDDTRFRRWLIDRLKETSYSIRSGETLETLAKRLGVRTEILRTAQAEKAQELLAMGRSPALALSSRARGRDVQLTVHCPKNVYDAIRARAEDMGMTPAEIIRAITNTLLSGPDNPYILHRSWLYQGVRQTVGPQNGKKWRLYFDVAMSVGAHVALKERAKRLETTKTALVRGAITDYLEGRMSGVNFTPVTMMWQNPKRYWTGDLIRKGEYHGHSGTIEPRVANQH